MRWQFVGGEQWATTTKFYPNENNEVGDEAGGEGALHSSVSSEDPGYRSRMVTGDRPGDRVEDGFDVATHGGGRLENVSGFNNSRALSEGFPAEDIDLSEDDCNIPASCRLEYPAPESVCGHDDRQRQSPATTVPWRLVCQLKVKRHDGGTSKCTGWFLGPRTVVTAGHCVYSHKAGGWAQEIEVIPGMDEANRPYGSQKSSRFRSVEGWIQGKNINYDYGAVVLPDNSLGNMVGWFGIAALTNASMDNLLVNNAGYPADKDFGTQWYNAGRITRIQSQRFFYMLDTYGGNSGGPVWRLRDGKRHVVRHPRIRRLPNSATRITASSTKR